MNYLVYEYAAGGTIADVLSDEQAAATFDWKKRVDSIMYVALALQYCHGKGVKHRDLKPQNLCFIDDSYRRLLLIDFGIATEKDGTVTIAGTPSFMAPEYKNKGKFYEKSEVYSLGVLIVCIVTGKTRSKDLDPLIESTKIDPMCLRQAKDAAAGEWDLQVLNEICTIASECVQKRKSVRPGIADILDRIFPLRKKFAPELSEQQSHALDWKLRQSFTGTTKRCRRGKLCACGRDAREGVTCHRGHSVCSLCLEGSVRRQVGSEYIFCQVGSCSEHFQIVDLKDSVGYDVLAEYALNQQTASQINEWEKNLNRVLHEIRGSRQEILAEIRISQQQSRAGFAFVASKRSDCPNLCILMPVKTSHFQVIPSMYKEYRLYFICAYDRTPTGSYITVKKTRKWVRCIAPVLKYSLFALKTASAVYGLPLPIFNFIPGGTESEQFQNMWASLSDVVDYSVYNEWGKQLSELRAKSHDEEAVQRLLCERADEIDASARQSILEVASVPGNNGWEDEMVPACRGGKWAWVKNENKIKYENEEF